MKGRIALLCAAVALTCALAGCSADKAPAVTPAGEVSNSAAPMPAASENAVARGIGDVARGMENGVNDMGNAMRNGMVR